MGIAGRTGVMVFSWSGDNQQGINDLKGMGLSGKPRRFSPEVLWRLGLLAVLAVAAVLAFAKLDAGGLRDGDEARYALVAENMLHSGDPWTMYYQGQPYFWKSPLRIWLTAATFKVVGISTWSIRFWSALAGVLAVWLTCLLGRNLYGKAGGLLAGFVLATTPGFLHVHGARTGEMDTALAAFMLLALLPLTRTRRKGDLLLSGVALAGCGLVKHVTLIPVVGVMLVAGFLVLGTRPGFSRRELIQACGLMAVLVLPWFVLQAFQHPEGLFNAYFGSVISQTTVSSPDADPGHLYYLGVLLAGAWPWMALLAVGVPWSWVAARRFDRRWLLPLVWLLVYMVIISLAKRKLPWYALPAYPLTALLSGSVVTLWRQSPRPQGPSMVATLLMAWVVLAWVVGSNTVGFADRPGYKVVMNGVFLLRGLADKQWLWLVAVLLLGGLGTLGWRRLPWLERATGVVASVSLAAVTVFALHNCWVPLQHSYAGIWETTLQVVQGAGYGPDQVMVVLPPAKGRDDVRRYYIRRLSSDGQEFDPKQAGIRVRQPGYSGAIVTGGNGWRRVDALLKRAAPGIKTRVVHAGGGLVMLKVENPG